MSSHPARIPAPVGAETSVENEPSDRGERDFQELDDFEQNMTEGFVTLASLFGLPRSLGQLYGLAFVSQAPIHFGEACTRLRMSKGAASQGLRFLSEVGALRRVDGPDARREYFAPVIELKTLIAAALKQRMEEHGPDFVARLRRLEAMVDQTTDSDVRQFRAERLNKVRRWHSRAGMLVPILLRMLS